MGTGSDRPHAEPMSMNEVEACLYEAIVTLETSPGDQGGDCRGRGHDDATIDQTLRDMTERGLVVQGGYGGEPVYEPARRDGA